MTTLPSLWHFSENSSDLVARPFLPSYWQGQANIGLGSADRALLKHFYSYLEAEMEFEVESNPKLLNGDWFHLYAIGSYHGSLQPSIQTNIKVKVRQIWKNICNWILPRLTSTFNSDKHRIKTETNIKKDARNMKNIICNWILPQLTSAFTSDKHRNKVGQI